MSLQGKAVDKLLPSDSILLSLPATHACDLQISSLLIMLDLEAAFNLCLSHCLRLHIARLSAHGPRDNSILKAGFLLKFVGRYSDHRFSNSVMLVAWPRATMQPYSNCIEYNGVRT